MLCLTSQNGSIGISGIFLQAKLMMMMVAAVPSDGVETGERKGEREGRAGIASVSSIPFLSFSIFSSAAAPRRTAVSGEIKIVGRKLLCSWRE